MGRQDSVENDEDLLIRGLQVVYALEHAERVRKILTASKSACHYCEYNHECRTNELCINALYAYIFHDNRPLPKCNKKSMSKKEYEQCRIERKNERDRRNKRISRAIEKVQQMASFDIFNFRKGNFNENLLSLRKPVFMILEDLYLKAAMNLDEFWGHSIIRYSQLPTILSDLSVVMAKYGHIIKEPPTIELKPPDDNENNEKKRKKGYTLKGKFKLKDGSIVDIKISLSPNNSDENQLAYIISYSVAWIKDGEPLYVWDNADDVGEGSAPFHIHIGMTKDENGRVHKNPQETWKVPSLVSMFCLIYHAYNEDGNYSIEKLKEAYNKYANTCYDEGY